MNKIIITTSWDDGHILDMKLADLLDKYNIKGTFYVSKNYLGQDRLSENSIREIAIRHEIGAHTINHPDLKTISSDEVLWEMKESKNWLETVAGNEIKMFCYPKGSFDLEVAKQARLAGFKGARTTERYKSSFSDPFLMSTTINVYPFPFRKKDADHYFWRYLFQPFIQQYSQANKFGVKFIGMSWPALAKSVFDVILERGGIFHLWGHSWEIEKYDMWNDLEKVLKYVSNRDSCKYLTNGQIF